MEKRRRDDLFARRGELLTRRDVLIAQARQRAQAAEWDAYVRRVPILTALETAGDDYRSAGYYALRGALNRWAHDPDRWPMLTERHWPLADDPAARDAAIMTQLRACAGPDDLVTAILRSEQLVLDLRVSVVARHLAALIDSAERMALGLAAPPAGWIIEVRHGISVGTLDGQADR